MGQSLPSLFFSGHNYSVKVTRNAIKVEVPPGAPHKIAWAAHGNIVCVNMALVVKHFMATEHL